MKTVPEFFYTTVRKVEPVSGNCVRLYCSIERNGGWEDRFTLVVPIAAVLRNAKFIVESATEMYNGTELPIEIERVH